jgi:hypothetical protein
MPERRQNKRPPPISYRPTRALEEEFYARVDKSGLSVSAFITKSIFDNRSPRQSRRSALEQKLLARLLGEAAKIRGDLHAIVLNGADNGNTLLIEQAVGDLSEIRAALLRSMGRKP